MDNIYRKWNFEVFERMTLHNGEDYAFLSFDLSEAQV